ncbi:hypothetical protein FSP39_004198 [Pinctada imbricata]|uniref:long-chain-fatty-acid--CoA ligase n=1 Tax=Pinctada imbricata TaxID=66713 RepID=A0AA89BWF0_PINIB|nr:hypothetical protein FSP39_004198 [Pinctada imbricata]
MNIARRFGSRINNDVLTGNFVIEKFENSVAKQGKKAMLIFEDRVYSWEFMNEQANRVANIVMQWGLKHGDVVALFVENSPEFVWLLLGLQKLGIGAALINYHIRAKPLLHSIRVSEAKALILGPEDILLHAIDEIRDGLDIPVYVSGRPGDSTPQGYHSWSDLMLHSQPAQISKAVRAGLGLFHPCIYIYTSGTTGLPKPAIISQAKGIGYTMFLQFSELSTDDIVYTITPLYHSAAILALFSVIDMGATMLLRRKFSATHYFEDIRRHKATMTQYIGELCRYLIHTPKQPHEDEHNLRVAIGNGLRMDIWEEFQQRFKIPKIVEFYGATEGTSASINVCGKVGACGRLSPFMSMLDPVKKFIVRYDPNTEAPYRNKEGRCELCKIDEAGILIAAIPPTYSGAFYKGGKEINEKKMIRNAFVDGDAFFNFGDLLYVDKDYFLYFKDRVGDTFRWKGENVSTNEVANILTNLSFIQDANVYGVTIPDTDGRAGMAALLLKENFKMDPSHLQQIYNHCQENLPSYARPIFIRIIPEMPLTTTHKQKKTEYVKQGFDPNIISDPLFVITPEEKTYTPLTLHNLSQFMSRARL